MKNIIVTTILILAIILKSNGQESCFSIGLIGSMEGNKYDFKSTNYVYNSQVGYSYGLGFVYSTKGMLFIESGLTYYSHGYNVNYNYIFMTEGDPLIPRQSNLTISYLRIPIKVGLHVFNFCKISFNPSIGLNTSFQISTEEKTTYEDNTQKESSLLSPELNEIQIGITLNLGFKYELTKKINLTIIPYLSKGLNKLENNDMNSGQISIGGLFGLYYNI